MNKKKHDINNKEVAIRYFNKNKLNYKESFELKSKNVNIIYDFQVGNILIMFDKNKPILDVRWYNSNKIAKEHDYKLIRIAKSCETNIYKILKNEMKCDCGGTTGFYGIEYKDKNIPSFSTLQGIVMIAVNKYSKLLRIKSETEDLESDCYLLYLDCINANKGKTIKKFSSLYYTYIVHWELKRKIDQKYLLIKKPYGNGEDESKNKKYIDSLDGGAEHYCSEEELEVFEDIQTKIDLTDEMFTILNDVEKYIIRHSYGINCKKTSLYAMAKELDLSITKIRGRKNYAMFKMRKHLAKKYKREIFDDLIS